MSTDRKVLYSISISTLAVLLLALVLPGETSGRILAAILLLPLAAMTVVFIKKRPILSINKNQILMIMAVVGLVCVMLYFLTGLRFGYYKNPYKLNFSLLLNYVFPIVGVIALTEVIRFVVRAQNSTPCDVIAYLSCVVAEVLIYSNIHHITSFNRFMDAVGLTLLPAIISNLLYHYISKRYGIFPNIVYRVIISLYTYVIPIKVGIPDSLIAFIKLIIPIAIYVFIDELFEKKRRYALVKRSKFGTVITVLAIAIMTMFIMLISNQFKFGTLVIATDSMTGELNKGDTVIYERYEGQPIKVGQVIAFESRGVVVVHRVVDIQIKNGEYQYFTKGDINEETDAGFVTVGNIVGTVNLKIPYVGYPTIWLRSLFKR